MGRNEVEFTQDSNLRPVLLSCQKDTIVVKMEESSKGKEAYIGLEHLSEDMMLLTWVRKNAILLEMVVCSLIGKFFAT